MSAIKGKKVDRPKYKDDFECVMKQVEFLKGFVVALSKASNDETNPNDICDLIIKEIDYRFDYFRKVD